MICTGNIPYFNVSLAAEVEKTFRRTARKPYPHHSRKRMSEPVHVLLLKAARILQSGSALTEKAVPCHNSGSSNMFPLSLNGRFFPEAAAPYLCRE